MIQNYFKIALRNLLKNKTFTWLNLGGLSISLAACLIIYFWVEDEMGYDRFGANADRVFRVGLILDVENQPTKQFALTAPPLAAALQKDYPEIEKVVRIMSNTPLIKVKNETFNTNKFFFADPSFFEVFGYPLLKGDPSTVLTGTNSAVISESIAKKYFGNEDPLGKTIFCNDTIPLIIKGISKDIPATNHFQFEVLCSMAVNDRATPPAVLANWWNDSYYTYLLLKDPSQAEALNKKIAGIIDVYNGEQNKAFGLKGTHFLQPIKDIHLHSKLRGELTPAGDMRSVRIFVGIGIFLLIVACINYVNLTTATSFRRAKEVGMRKVSGATLVQLMGQFLTESIILAFVSLVIAMGLAALAIPFFNKLAGTTISFALTLTSTMVLQVFAVVLLLGLLAGLYPALYLSQLKPIAILRKMGSKAGTVFSLRKVLVVFQFSLTIILIIATIVALLQLRFMQTRELGFTREAVIGIPLINQTAADARELLKSEFQKNSDVIVAAASSGTPGQGLSNIAVLPEGVPQGKSQTMGTLVIDKDFVETYQLKIIAGRGFSREFNDSLSFILNETAVRELGWGEPQKAIGKSFDWGTGKVGKVIGVVRDFHFNSLQQKVQPLVMHIMQNWFWYSGLSVRISTQDPKAAIDKLNKIWKSVLPAHPFDYYFVDEDYDKQYRKEQLLSRLSLIFSGLIIFISSIGLLGLVMVAVSQRTKEIGIRKVLGASVSGLTVLLSRDFLKLVAIAMIIAFPVSWWMMKEWLNDFAYKMNLGWWIFLLAGLLALLIAWITVSIQTIKAAIANPVKSLRSE